jgi:hypothetical protein
MVPISLRPLGGEVQFCGVHEFVPVSRHEHLHDFDDAPVGRDGSLADDEQRGPAGISSCSAAVAVGGRAMISSVM